jgi:hypothetical protein
MDFPLWDLQLSQRSRDRPSSQKCAHARGKTIGHGVVAGCNANTSEPFRPSTDTNLQYNAAEEEGK